MKRIFLSVGTSLFDPRRSLLGPPRAFQPLWQPPSLAAWDEAVECRESAELPSAEAEERLRAAVEAAGKLARREDTPDLAKLLDDLPRRIQRLRDAFVLGGDEAEKTMLSAELASLCRLLVLYPLGPGDRMVALATDSPEGRVAGTVIAQVLDDHPALAGAEVEVVWPRHWQPHDALRLARSGASNLLAAVSLRIAQDLRVPPLFVLTGGLKLGIAVLSQVSCWSQAAGHDGLFLKLQDPGGVFFPPSSFQEEATGPTLLPHEPATAALRPEVPFTKPLLELTRSMKPPRGGHGTTLLVTVGVGLVRASAQLLEARFGSSVLAHKATWDRIDKHGLSPSWKELRSVMEGAPSDRELEDTEGPVLAQLRRAWNDGASADLPAELAALRSLWVHGQPQPIPRLGGGLRVVLLTTDSLTGEFCASRVADFLATVEGVVEVVERRIPGFHPYGSLPRDGAFFTRMAEIVGSVVAPHERLLMVPLAGIKLHLPLLTVLATRLRSPMILGHVGLDRPVVFPWLESDGRRVWGARDLDAAWPELASLPAVRLEVEGG